MVHFDQFNITDGLILKRSGLARVTIVARGNYTATKGKVEIIGLKYQALNFL